VQIYTETNKEKSRPSNSNLLFLIHRYICFYFCFCICYGIQPFTRKKNNKFMLLLLLLIDPISKSKIKAAAKTNIHLIVCSTLHNCKRLIQQVDCRFGFWGLDRFELKKKKKNGCLTKKKNPS